MKSKENALPFHSAVGDLGCARVLASLSRRHHATFAISQRE